MRPPAVAWGKGGEDRGEWMGPRRGVGRGQVAHEAWAREQGVRVEVRGEGLHVWADLAELRRVLINLVSNAFEAMAEGGTLSVEVARREEKDGPRVVIEVADSGVGLSDTVRARLFEPYFTTRSHGTGLGLAISRRLGLRAKLMVASDSNPLRIHSGPVAEGQAVRLGDVAGERIAGWLDEDGVALRLATQVQVIASGPAGVAIRTRLKHLTAQDEEVLSLVGAHLGSLASNGPQDALRGRSGALHRPLGHA